MFMHIQGRKKENKFMKILVVSDIHGSNYYTEKIEEIYRKENADRIILSIMC